VNLESASSKEMTSSLFLLLTEGTNWVRPDFHQSQVSAKTRITG